MATAVSTLPPAGVPLDGPSREALAQRFSARLAHQARYVASWNRWLLFDGTAWRPDTTARMRWEARVTCRDAEEETNDPRARAGIVSTASIAAIERLARDDRMHVASPDQFDADPFLLNTPAGTIDLRSGAMRGHQRDDYITRTTAVSPGGDCPLFRAFLARVFAKDAALIGFVQRALGCALTGDMADQALFFAYGTGGNGKSVLLNTVREILGGYAAPAPMDAFTAVRRERDPTDLAMLQGVRLVVAQEIAQGRYWDEARIKALTGGDPFVARHRHGELFAYQPRFKLFIAGNHAPALRTVDAAMRRRLKLIPFAVTIPEAEVDRDLPRKLRAEWPGILAWMIAGCREWQRMGLAPPPAVTQATAEYFAEEDAFGGWLEEWVSAAPETATETTADLFASWETYAGWAQEPAGSRKAFARAMRARGFVPCRIGKASAKGFKGLALRRHSEASVMLAAMSGRKTPFEGL